MEGLNELDILAIVVYFILVILAGFYSVFRSNRDTLSGFFLAGRQMTWLPVGASLFASNIGSEHFIGLAGSGAAAGIAVGAFEITAAIVLQVLGWVFLPVYIASRVSTLPEYMAKRFGGSRIRIFLALLSLLLYVFAKISVNLYSGALFIRQILNWDLYLSIGILLLITGLATITGGLAAVIYTDTLQCFIMLIGATILTVKGFYKVNGFMELMVQYTKAVPSLTLPNSTCGYPLDDAWRMLRDPLSADMPWVGYCLGQTTAALWYWCSDQMMVQRALASKSLSHARGATLFTGYLKFLPLFLIVLPGMISRVLYTDIVACTVPEECLKHCGSRIGCSNLAYPLLVLNLMPSGLKGILIAVVLAALMSDMTSIFNSASTLFSIDIWLRMRKSASSKELLIVGKLFVLFMVGLSIAWIPIIIEMQGGQLFNYIQAISAYLAPPISAIYLLAMFWKRFNELGAFSGLMSGFAVGAVRMGLDFYYQSPACGEKDTRPLIVAGVHYMYFAMILFWTTVLVAVVVTLASKPPEEFRLIRTLYWTRFDTAERRDENKKVAKREANSHVMETTVGCDQLNAVSVATIQTSNFVNIGKSTSTLVSEVENPQIAKWKTIAFWICGYNPNRELPANEEDNSAQLPSLRQNPAAAIFLNGNLVLIVIVTITLHVFFTVGTPRLLDKYRGEI